ncbi:Lrp/AsnC family transcriptional regulator [Haloarcula argentinensis]|uniref:Lrp/AsnC family transcriptional regulator n=1 Tax=Haloarcula argentinensis TaxID=43776 RepID=A0ABU2F2C8_HALAR|nr:Lrp/AsnC family transcriptional regulator [Haloarcula argentinensis]MDS0254718.1 Lrp/AsnC family transcriptional regulator [Haloarcula argentinensis]
MTMSNTNTIEDRVIEQLYTDSTQTSDDIAGSIDATPTEVEHKINELREEGKVGSEIAVVDPARVGYSVPSYHLVDLERNYDGIIDEGLKKIGQWEGSQVAMITLGDYDVIIRKISKSGPEVDRFSTNVFIQPDRGSGKPDIDSKFYSMETFTIQQWIRWRGSDFKKGEQRDRRTVDLNDLQRIVLNELQSDASFRNRPSDLSDKIDMISSPDEVAKAIDYLIDKEVIRKFSVRIDPGLTDGWYRAFFGISTERGRYDDVVDNLQTENPLYVPYILSGLGFNWADIAIELNFKSIDHLDNITDRIRSMDGVKRSRTFLSTRVPYFIDEVPLNSPSADGI